jgi:mono/diheme cytochrome c family protein
MRKLTALLIAAALLGGVSRAVSAQDAKVLYEKHCKSCHGPAVGEPLPAMVKAMNVPSVTDARVSALSEDSLVKVITKGKGKFMKPYSATLKPAEITALAKYLKTLTKKT